MKKAALLIFCVLLIDQISKIYIKTHFHLGEEVLVLGDWFRLHFIENPGMAFGMQLGGGASGKLVLSIARIIAISLLSFYLYVLARKKTAQGVLIGLSLVVAGAIGNMIDSAFYGMLFSHSGYSQPAVFMPPSGGYAGFLHGRVVDMLYFPLFSFRWPSWLPVLGGHMFEFFQPVFNIADSAVTIGFAYLLLFQRKFLFSKKA